MKTKRPTSVQARRRIVRRGLALSDSVLRLFPRTSRMNKAEPSIWEVAGRVRETKSLSVSPPSYS